MSKSIAALWILSIPFPNAALAWTFELEADKMTDEKSVSLYQASSEPVWAGKKAGLQVLLNCNDGKYSLVLNHPWLVEPKDVKMRLDKDTPVSVYAYESIDHKALYLGEPNKKGKQEKIVDRLVGHKMAVFRYGSVGGGLHDPEFSLDGFEAQLKKAKECVKVKIKKTN